jgi:hypothetical protein
LLESIKDNRLQRIDELLDLLNPVEWDQVRDQAIQVNPYLTTILEYCFEPKSRKEICEKIGLTNKNANFKRYAGEPLEFGWLEMMGNPNSSNVRYSITEKGKKLI